MLEFLKSKNVEIKSIKITDFIYKYISGENNFKKRYKNSFRNLVKHIQCFETQTGLVLYTNSFSENVTEEFILYLRNKNLMSNSVINIFQRLQAALNKAARRGYAVERGFENIRLQREDSGAVYLNLEELDKLNNLKNLSPESRACRDRFLIGCFTALRISDYRKLTAEDNFKNGNIQIKTQKTGATVIIPIHPIIEEILKRNNNILPKIPSQQAFGATIKRICKKAGFTEPILWERTVGNRVVRKKIPKYQLVSSHTARRSAATNMYLAGIKTARIMLLTGHTTEQSFFKYIRIAKEDNARELSQHEFFKKKN